MKKIAIKHCRKTDISIHETACSLANPMRPSPILRETKAIVAIINPMPKETEKNWIAKAKPIAATKLVSPICEIQKRFTTSTKNTKVIPAVPDNAILQTCPIVGPVKNLASSFLPISPN